MCTRQHCSVRLLIRGMWGAAAGLLVFKAWLEMMYQFGPVAATPAPYPSQTQPTNRGKTPRPCTPLGELSTCSISTNASIDGRALVHQATLFVRAHLTCNDEPLTNRSNLLAFILHKLPEKWIDRTYTRIEQYQAKHVEP